MYYICEGEPPNTTISFLILDLKEHKLALILSGTPKSARVFLYVVFVPAQMAYELLVT